MNIRNIILDLGGVIINLDTQKTIDAFNKIGNVPFEKLYNQSQQNDLFNSFASGLITETEFFKSLQKTIKHTGHESDLIKAWNAMLLDVPAQRLKLLEKLRSRYRTFLLSNTCEPHIQAFEAELFKQHGIKNFERHFEKVYYSCRMNMRKPDPEIFERVLSENNLKAEETVFIDDSAQHVEGAKKVGISAFLLPKDKELEELLKEIKVL